MRAAIALLLAVVTATTSIAHAQPGASPQPDPSPAPPDPSAPTAQPDPYPPAPYPPAPYPPAPYPDPLPPQPQPQPVQPPPYYQPVAVQLTAGEHALLQKGEISDGAHIAGGAVALGLGFGLGQAVQGRWAEKGWLFTVGSAASVAAIVVGVSSLNSDSDEVPALFIAGYLSFLVFHVWGTVDAFIEPPKHNRRVRELKMRLGMPGPYFGNRMIPYVNKTRDGGGTAGLVLRF